MNGGFVGAGGAGRIAQAVDLAEIAGGGEYGMFGLAAGPGEYWTGTGTTGTGGATAGAGVGATVGTAAGPAGAPTSTTDTSIDVGFLFESRWLTVCSPANVVCPLYVAATG